MKKTTQNWIATSDYDIETAEHMLKTGRYIYVVFMCHLAVEKLLKAIVAESGDELPPKTHNLRYLVRLGGIKVPAEHEIILDLLNSASIPTRYPDDLTEMQKQYPEDVAQDYLRQTRELLRWLRSDARLRG